MRQFSGWLLLAMIVCICGRSPHTLGAETVRRPNFVFILSDDQRWDALGVVQREQGAKARFPWLRTPNLDRLAAEGVRFRNAFVVNSLCSPSRASFLTGTYGWLNGVVNNHTPFPSGNVSYATQLRQAGYLTGFVGKWHMDGQRGQRPGFDYSASFIGQGKYWNCPMEINGVDTPTTGWVDDISTDYALRFMRANKDRPFALQIGFKACHGPFEPPPRWESAYRDDQARPVPSLQSTAVYLPAGGRPRNPGHPKMAYFRCVSSIDENVGRILDELDKLGLARDTMVIFASDNGFYFGEHGLGDKRSAYDESLRIPLIVRYPRLPRKGLVIDPMALNTDLAPTLLDYAGLPPGRMQGRSWRPLLEGKTGNWRTSFFYAYYFERPYNWVPPMQAVRTDTAKLIRYPGHPEWTELFDLVNDPYEMTNLAGDPARKQMLKQMDLVFKQQADAIDFRVPDFADPVEFGKPARPRRGGTRRVAPPR